MKIDKTEREAREALAKVAIEWIARPPLEIGPKLFDMVKAALGLEFREEGLPERVFHPDGKTYLLRLNQGRANRCLNPEEYAEAARRYNDFPALEAEVHRVGQEVVDLHNQRRKLEALARELGSVLTLYHYAPGRCRSEHEDLPCRACALLSRLRELLGEEE